MVTLRLCTRRSTRKTTSTMNTPARSAPISETAPITTSSAFGMARTAWSAGSPAAQKRTHWIAPPIRATNVTIPIALAIGGSAATPSSTMRSHAPFRLLLGCRYGGFGHRRRAPAWRVNAS